MKSKPTRAIALLAGLLLGAVVVMGKDVVDMKRHAAHASSDPHLRIKGMRPFDAQVVRKSASGLAFSNKSSMEAAAGDALEYYDLVGDGPKLRQDGPIVLGKIVVKKDGLRFADTDAPIPPGEYYHWIGKKDGMWMGGFASTSGDVSVPSEVRFAVQSDQGHTHLQTWTHDPDAAKAWRGFATAALPLPGTPPLPPGGSHPPPPPKEWRCVEVWKWVKDADGNKVCTVTGWVRVPA